MDLKLEIDAKKIIDSIKEKTEKIQKDIEDDLKKAVVKLGKGAKKHAEKLASESDTLPKSLEEIYRENLYMEQISDNIVEVGVREEALWIELGRKGGRMKELLDVNKSGSPTKVSKDGNRYRVIPFEKSTGKKGVTGTAASEINELKSFLKNQGVRYSKNRALALDENGSPRIGRIHSFNIKDMRDGKKASVKNLSRNLQGISVYQNENPKTGKVERSIMTFRVISDSSKGWNHPGRDPENIISKTFEWVEQQWGTQVLPDLKKKYESK
jgi:hypothetical protein